VLPGISSYESIMANHCGEFIGSARARARNLLDDSKQESAGVLGARGEDGSQPYDS
jgi:nickel-dependent lactate racemase